MYPAAPIRIVLHSPEIPQNTGNIARFSAAFNLPLHLIEPLGFDISEKAVRRAGLDYWPEVDLHVHQGWDAFLHREQPTDDQLLLLTTKTERSFESIPVARPTYLVFGRETAGLPEELHKRYPGRRGTIAMANDNVRSLNLANSVALVSYQLLRGC